MLLLSFLFLKYVFSYWSRKGFPSIQANIPLGCLGPVVKQKQSFGELIRDLHLGAKDEPYLGLYFLHRPALLVRDPELVKRILVTDFEYFHDRGIHYDEENDPIGAGLFAMPGIAWKDMRARLSPTFTSGKLKNMFSAIEQKTFLLRDHLTELTETEGEVRLKTAAINLNISIIADVFFGFELNAFKDPDHEFAQIGNKFFDTTAVKQRVKFAAQFLYPKLLTQLRIPTVPPLVAKYVLNLVKNVMEARRQDPTMERKDFIQTVLKMIESDSEMTVHKGTAQAFIFYLGGYETSAATTSYCMYELSKNPEWLKKVRVEVDALMEKRKGRILYEDLPELKVLELCTKEAMRMYPALPLLNRECTKNYKIPGSDRVIPKGTPIFLSNFGLQMDEQHFPNPEKFDPSRFEEQNMVDNMPFYPMGGGPHYCVGELCKRFLVKGL